MDNMDNVEKSEELETMPPSSISVAGPHGRQGKRWTFSASMALLSAYRAHCSLPRDKPYVPDWKRIVASIRWPTIASFESGACQAKFAMLKNKYLDGIEQHPLIEEALAKITRLVEMPSIEVKTRPPTTRTKKPATNLDNSTNSLSHLSDVASELSDDHADSNHSQRKRSRSEQVPYLDESRDDLDHDVPSAKRMRVTDHTCHFICHNLLEVATKIYDIQVACPIGSSAYLPQDLKQASILAQSCAEQLLQMSERFKALLK